MLHGLHIPEHAYGRHGTRALHHPRRTRKLLLYRSEIDKTIGRLGDAGVALVPLSLYFQEGWVKVEIALDEVRTPARGAHITAVRRRSGTCS